VEILAGAIELSKFYLAQVKLIHSEANTLSGEISDIYSKLINLSQRSGWLKAKTVRNSVWALRSCSMNEIRQHFRELVALGQGCTRGKGNRLEWNYLTVDAVEESR